MLKAEFELRSPISENGDILSALPVGKGKRINFGDALPSAWVTARLVKPDVDPAPGQSPRCHAPRSARWRSPSPPGWPLLSVIVSFRSETVRGARIRDTRDSAVAGGWGAV
jgi:hypothetical protein